MSATVELDLTSTPYETLVRGPRRIPVEIWRCIFNFCFPHEWGVDFTARRAQDELGPWAIVAVCSHWRKIALETREVWSSFKIGPARHDPARFKQDPIALSIERARGAPLSLTLDDSMSHFPHRVPVLIPWKQVQNLAIVHSSINEPGDKFDLQYILDQCTELRTLDICHYDEHTDSRLVHRERSPIVLPFLRQMTLGSATLVAHESPLRAPNIEALGMTVHKFDLEVRSRIITFLRHSGSKLQQLRVRIAPHPGVQTYLAEWAFFLGRCSTRALPNLRQLDIHLPGVSFQGELHWLQRCRIPQLEILRLFFGQFAATAQTSTLAEQLEASCGLIFPNLKEFVLFFADIATQIPQGMDSQVEVLQLEYGIKVTLIFNNGRDATES